MCMFGVTQGIEDRGERSDGGYGSEQDGSGAERLAAGDIEAGSAESGDAGWEGLLHGWSLGIPGANRVGGGPPGLAATGIVNGLPHIETNPIAEELGAAALRSSPYC